jgi:tetratricopeptide (TPR) repeat protein
MAVNAGDWDEAQAPADEAAAADPDMNAYQISRGLAASGRADWEAAADAYERAALVDDMPQSWLGLAQAQAELGKPAAEVAASLERAHRSGSQQPAVLFAMGSLYDRLGMTEEADAAYADVLAAYPALAADPALTADPIIGPRLAGIIERAAASTPGIAWELALMSGDAETAQALARDRGGAAWTPLVVEAWLGNAEAAEELHALADANPSDAAVLGWAARIAARNGDPDRAERYERLATFAAFDGPSRPGTDIRIERTEWLQDVPAGALTWYAGQWLYRRPTAFDLIPPGLPRLVFVDRDEE